jgi:hypothetical protein
MTVIPNSEMSSFGKSQVLSVTILIGKLGLQDY